MFMFDRMNPVSGSFSVEIIASSTGSVAVVLSLVVTLVVAEKEVTIISLKVTGVNHIISRQEGHVEL